MTKESTILQYPWIPDSRKICKKKVGRMLEKLCKLLVVISKNCEHNLKVGYDEKKAKIVII